MRTVVVAYQAAWPERAAVLAASLGERLGPRAGRIEHIGSTSILGMAAKDVLDMQVSLAEAASAFDQPLAGLGFGRTPHESDHVPAGLADDPRRWAKRLWSRRGPLAPLTPGRRP